MEDIISLAKTKSNSDLTHVYTMRNCRVHGRDFRESELKFDAQKRLEGRKSVHKDQNVEYLEWVF